EIIVLLDGAATLALGAGATWAFLDLGAVTVVGSAAATEPVVQNDVRLMGPEATSFLIDRISIFYSISVETIMDLSVSQFVYQYGRRPMEFYSYLDKIVRYGDRSVNPELFDRLTEIVQVVYRNRMGRY